MIWRIQLNENYAGSKSLSVENTTIGDRGGIDKTLTPLIWLVLVDFLRTANMVPNHSGII